MWLVLAMFVVGYFAGVHDFGHGINGCIAQPTISQSPAIVVDPEVDC
jgi:hypothetical protein